MFWDKVVGAALKTEGPAQIFMLFGALAVWAAMTFGVLMVMETLSAALHDIRLHWYTTPP